MNIFGIIKELYCGKDNLIAQLGLFALIGIMTIAFNEVISAYTGNTLYSLFAVPSEFEVIIFSLAAIIVTVFFTGYIYKFVHDSYTNEQAELPSISMNCFVTFLRLVPLGVVWGIYLFFIIYIGLLLFSYGVILYIFLVALGILLPFINIVFLLFAKDFKYNSRLFSPGIIVNIMKKSFVPTLLFVIQYILIMFIVLAVCVFVSTYIYGLNVSRFSQLIYTLVALCIGSYIQQVLNLAYYNGLTKIIKKNLI